MESFVVDASTKDELNVLIIGDPHVVDSAIKEIEELTQKLSLMIEKINTGVLSFEELNSYFDGKDIPEDRQKLDKFDIAIIMGDALDRHEKCTVYSHKKALDLFDSISKYMPLFVIIGNHDRPYNSDFLSDYHFFNGLKDKKNLYIIDKVKIYTFVKQPSGVPNIIDSTNLPEIRNAPHSILFVPYVPNGRFMEAIGTVIIPDITKITCICAHQEIYNCRYNGIVSKNGDKLDHDKLPLIISGHIHEYGKLKGVTYVGSSRQITRVESHDKTVSIFKFGLHGIEERRVNMNLIKKINMVIKVSQLHTLVVPSNCLLYLIIEGTKTEIKSLKKLATFKPIIENKNIKVYYRTDLSEDTIVDEDQKARSKTGGTFIEKLKSRICNNKEQFELFQELFENQNTGK